MANGQSRLTAEARVTALEAALRVIAEDGCSDLAWSDKTCIEAGRKPEDDCAGCRAKRLLEAPSE